MDELIVIELVLFHEYKPSCVVKLSGTKIEGMFALDCFNEAKFKQVTAAMKPRPQVGHGPNHGQGHGPNQGHGQGQYNNNNHHNNNNNNSRSFFSSPREVKAPRARIGIQSYHDKFMREITGNLNKINGSNMDAVFKRIEKIIDANNVNEVIGIVLTKACTNGTYMQHFISLLDKLDATYKGIVPGCIHDFADKFINTLVPCFDQLALYDYEDYDQFCKFLKEKNTIMSTNKLVLVYMDKQHSNDDGDMTIIECTPDLYFEKLVNMIDASQPVHLQDMLVQLLSDLFASKHGSSEHTCHQLAHIYHDSLEEFISTKSKFMFQDIMQANELKNSNVFICKARRGRRT
jgi:hypothetical protein